MNTQIHMKPEIYVSYPRVCFCEQKRRQDYNTDDSQQYHILSAFLLYQMHKIIESLLHDYTKIFLCIKPQQDLSRNLKHSVFCNERGFETIQI